MTRWCIKQKYASRSFFPCPKFVEDFLVSKKMLHLHFFSCPIFLVKQNASHSFFSCPGFLGQLGGTLSKNNSPLCFCPGFLVNKKRLTFILFWCRIFGKPNKTTPFFLSRIFGATRWDIKQKRHPLFCPGVLSRIFGKQKNVALSFSFFFLSKIFGKKNASRSFFFLSRIFGKPKDASPKCFLVHDFW